MASLSLIEEIRQKVALNKAKTAKNNGDDKNNSGDPTQEVIGTAGNGSGNVTEQPAQNSSMTTTMAASSSANVMSEHLDEFLKQGPILLKLQNTMTKVEKRLSTLERNERKLPAEREEDRVSKKSKVDSDSKDSDSEVDNSGSKSLIPSCSYQPKPSALTTFLSDGEISDDGGKLEDSDDELF